MNNKFDIEDYILEVKEIVNVLKCFDEFCDESVLPENTSKQEREENAVWFVKRLKSHRSLLSISIKNLEQNLRLLKTNFDLTQ